MIACLSDKGEFMRTLINLACTLAIASMVSNNLPKIIYVMNKAKLQLIQDSKASKWPKAVQLSVK